MMKRLIFSFSLAVIAPLTAQPEPWEEKQIYAVPDFYSFPELEKNTVVTLNALFAPDKHATISCEESVKIIQWDKETLKTELSPLELPQNIEKIISNFHVEKSPETTDEIQKLPFRVYRSKRDSYLYSVDIFPPYQYLYRILQSFGKTFFITDPLKPTSTLNISCPEHTDLIIERCALDARNGQLPVFFRYSLASLPDGKIPSSHSILGLVDVKTGKLTPLGFCLNVHGNPECGPLAWIDDHTIAIILLSRKSTEWAVFDIDKKTVVAQKSIELLKDDDDGKEDNINKDFIWKYIIRDKHLFGIQTDDTIVQLYPLHRWHHTRTTIIDEELPDKIDVPFQTAVPSHPFEKMAEENSQN